MTTSEEVTLPAAPKLAWRSKLALNLVIGALIATIMWAAFLVAFMGYLIGLWR
jgi:hypothetical protein